MLLLECQKLPHGLDRPLEASISKFKKIAYRSSRITAVSQLAKVDILFLMRKKQ